MKSRSPFYLVVTMFFFLFFIRFWPFLIGKTIFFGDTYALFVPGKLVVAQMLRAGVWPLWNPYVLGGVSILGDINQSLISLSTPLFVFLQPVFALNFTVAIYTFLAFVGMYLLARSQKLSLYSSILAGTIWIYSGGISGALGNISILQSLALVPWVLWGARLKKPIPSLVVTVITMAALVLGGYPQLAPYVVVLGVFLVPKQTLLKTLIWWGSVVGIAVVIASPLLLPFAKTLLASTRTLQTKEQALSGSVHPIDLVSIVLPRVFVDGQEGIKWGPQWSSMNVTTLFIPWILIIFTALSFPVRSRIPQYRVLLGLIGASLLFSFAQSIPIISWIFTAVPLLQFTRGPAHVLVVAYVAIALLSAQIMERARISQLFITRIMVWGLLTLLILGIFSWLVLSNFPFLWSIVDGLVGGRLSSSPFHNLQRDTILAKHFLTIFSTHLSLLCVSLFLYKRKAHVLLILVIAFQMQLATASHIFFASASIYPTWDQIETKAQTYQALIGDETLYIAHGNMAYTDLFSYMDALTVRQPFSDSFVTSDELRNFARLARMQATLTPNWNSVYRVRSITGYVSLLPKEIDQRWREVGESVVLNRLPPIDHRLSELSQQGIQYILVDPWYPNGKQFEQFEAVAFIDGAILYRLSSKD